MSNLLGGTRGTAYLGTAANQPPNFTSNTRDPNQYDTKNVSIGDIWLNQDTQAIFILTSLQGNSTSKGQLAMWTELNTGSGTSTLDELTGDTGGVILPDGSGNINIVSGISGVSFDGNPSTHTITLNSTIGADFVQTLTGNTGPAVTGPNINVVGDGTTVTTAGNAGSHTITISLAGDVSTAFPTDDGTANPSGGNLNIITDNAATHSGSTVKFVGSGNTVQLNVTDVLLNTIIGFDSGNLTLTGQKNTILGAGCGAALTTGSSNIFLGISAGDAVTTGSDNFICGNALTNSVLAGTTTMSGFYAFSASSPSTLFLHNWGGEASGNTFVGFEAGDSFNAGQASDVNNTGVGQASLSTLTTGSNNTALGYQSGAAITTGAFNVLLGEDAGLNYVGNESSNICIGYGNEGTAAESHVLRIGSGTGSSGGELQKAFISGIDGVNVGSTANIVTEVGNQLGTAVLTAGSNITITPTANAITIASSGGGGGGASESFLVYLNPGITGPLPAVLSPVPYNNIQYDNGSNWNSGGFYFTAPFTGIYNFSIGLGLNNITNANPIIAVQVLVNTILVNPVADLIVFNPANVNPVPPTSVSRVNFTANFYINMTAGDNAIPRIRTYSSGTSGSMALSGLGLGLANWFSGVFIGTP